jgi:hypothetical protein
MRAILIDGSRSSHRTNLACALSNFPFCEGDLSLRLKNPIKNKLVVVLVLVLCASLTAPSLAGAQSGNPTKNQYNDTLTQINAGNPPDDSGSGSGLGGNVGPLPFTGFDVIAMAAVALAVTGLGLALQRAVSRDPSDELGS